MGETLLVTGSTGFIGRRLLRHPSLSGEKLRVFLRPGSLRRDLAAGVEEVRGGSLTTRMRLGVPLRGWIASSILQG